VTIVSDATIWSINLELSITLLGSSFTLIEEIYSTSLSGYHSKIKIVACCTSHSVSTYYGATALSITAFSITTPSIMTFSITTLSVTTFSITTPSIIMNKIRHSAY
jgi:hypothetical protein